MDVEELRCELTRLVLMAAAGHEDSYLAVHRKVLSWHEQQGDAELVSLRRTFVALQIIDEHTQQDIAERLGVNVRTVERDVAVLRQVFEPISKTPMSGAPR